MKKVYLLTLVLFFGGSLFAQQAKLVTQKQLQGVTYDQKRKQLLKSQSESIVNAKDIAPVEQVYYSTRGKTNAINPVKIGRAANAFTILRTEQNQVMADNATNAVTFIHRNDVTLYGGGGTENGKYRYDLSIDGGTSFTTDIGALQTTYTNYGRYPNITIHNAGETDPFNTNVVWGGPTNKFPTPGWIGHAYGYADVTQGTVTSSEHYLFDADQTLLPGGMCEGLPGEFWMTEFKYDGTNILDSIYVYKGTYNGTSMDVDWARAGAIYMPWNTAVTGSANAVGPVISFSPDGMTGWVAVTGDITGGPDSTLNPIFVKSTDGGATWGSPSEVDMNSKPWVKDSLQMLWVSIDSVTGDTTPASNGVATTAFDIDLIVDKNGNPHFGVVVGTVGQGQAYSIAGTAKFYGDIHSTDGGTTWDINYVAPVLTLRGEFGQPDAQGDLLTIDNFCQIARDATGDHIFYSWVDSDTSVIGFGEADNLAPNLRIASLRLSDGFKSCYKLVSDGDVLWDGKILCPTMSPVVLEDDVNTGCYKLPIVFMQMISNDQGQPCVFHYLGQDATFSSQDYVSTNPNLAWGACQGNTTCLTISTTPGVSDLGISLLPSYPNPADNNVTFAFEMDNNHEISLNLTNLYGQNVATLAEGRFTAGTHKIDFNTSNLAAGIYFYTLTSGEFTTTEKLVITH